uniref:Putative m13 family peptidase n=1 Tax=Amblyomma aureolatum TaxID=187763 RepID=A0A1E1X3J1_9ACAR
MSKLRAQVTSAVANIPSLVIVLLCVLLLVFFVIIVALSVKVHSGAGTPEARCLTASCLRSAGRVLEGLGMDAAAPCDDPYTFACGRRGGDAGAALRRRAHHAVRHLVDLAPVDGDQATAEAKAKRFYETCMEPRSLSQDALALLNYRLRQVGGWELISSSSWSLQSWDRDTALEKLQVDLGVSPFFELGVADHTIRLEPAGFTFPSYEYYADSKPESRATKVLSSYRELIERVSTHLRDGPPSLANAELADTIINYERRLLERLRPRENVSEPSGLRTTVAQLTRMVPIVKWEQLLSAYFHGHSIGQDTPVLILQPHYFSGLSQIISTTDTTTLNHYMMWRMVMKYAPHLDRNVRSLYFRFQQLIHGAEDPDQPEEHWWEQCARHTSHYLRHAVGYLYATKAAGSRVEDTVQQAMVLAEQVRKSAVDSVGSVAWLTDKGQLREKLSSVEFRVGYAFKDRPRELDHFYLDLIVKLGSHLENVFEAERFLGRKKARLLSDRAADMVEDQAWTISAVDTRPVYNQELNAVVVPLAALQNPIFSLEEHPALQYGSFGSLVGRLIFECLDQAGADEDLFRNNATRASLWETLRCLANGYPALDKTLPVNGLLVAGEALADLAGLTAAFRAFETESSGKDKLPGLEWTAEQLFFIGYAQSMCEEVLLRRLEIWSLVSSSAPKRLRVLQTLRQFPEFGRSFECTTDPEQSHICHAW